MKLKDRLEAKLKTMNRSRRTFEAYYKWLVAYCKFTDMQHPSQTISRINDFLSFLAVDKNLSPNTVNQAGHALIFIYRKVLGLDIPYIDLPKKTNRKPPVVFSKDEVGKVLTQFTNEQHLIISIMYGSGLRISECLNLRIKDIDFDNNQILIYNGKGSKSRLAILPSPIINDLRLQIEKARVVYQTDLLNDYDGTILPEEARRKYPSLCKSLEWQFLFPAKNYCKGTRLRYRIHQSVIHKAVKKAIQKAGILKHASSHTFRHSFGTHLLQNQVNIRTIQELLGHSSLRTTMIYTHVLDTERRSVESPLASLEPRKTTLKIFPIAN